MRITILGSGIGGSQIPGAPSRYSPAFLVQWDDMAVLFDCSEGVRFRLDRLGQLYSDIRHIAISHAHPDHNALVHFVHAVAVRNHFTTATGETLNVYVPRQIAEDFPSVWKGYVPDNTERKEKIWPTLSFNILPNENDSAIQIGSGKLQGYDVYHGAGKCDAISFRLTTPYGVFAYSGDTGDCEGVRKAAQEADVFICEASADIGSFQSARAYGHLTPFQAGDIAKYCSVKKLILFHYSGLETDDALISDCRSSGYEGELFCGKDFEVYWAAGDKIC